MIKKQPKGFLIVSLISLLLILLVTPLLFSSEDEKQVRISWTYFKKLLLLENQEITLTWDEFQKLIAQTGENTKVLYSIKNGKVILTKKQFSELLNNMKEPKPFFVTPPANYIVNKAEYSGEMNKNSTVISAIFTIEIFETKDQRYKEIPLLPQSAGLEDVLLDGGKALVFVKNGWYNLTTFKTGLHQIKVKYYYPSNLEKGPQILNLPIIKTAITTFKLSIPLIKTDFSVPNAKEMIVTERNNSTNLRVILPAGNRIVVNAHRKYTARKDAAQKIPAKVYAETFNLLSVEDDVIRIITKIDLSILQNTISEINAVLPENYNILYIRNKNGKKIPGWFVKETDKGSMVNIPFDNPAEGSKKLEIISELLFNEQKVKIDFNGFKIENTIRETGYVGVEKKSTAQVVPTYDQLDLLDIKDLPYELIGMSKRPLLFGLRYLRHPYNLSLSITKHKEIPTISSIIDMANIITVVLEDGKTITKVNYSIRNTWKQSLKLDLPVDSEIWTVYVNSIRENASKSQDGKILIPLVRSQAKDDVLKSFSVQLIYYGKGNPLKKFGTDTIQFPTADIMISKMLWSVYLPAKYQYLGFSGNLEKEEMARTINLFLGKSRDFSLDQVNSYNQFARTLEKTYDKKKQKITKYQKSLQSNFMNQSINQNDMAKQLRLEANLSNEFQAEQTKRLGQPGIGSNIFKIELPTSGKIYRFNKSVIEAEPIAIKYIYASQGLILLLKILLVFIIIILLYLLRKKLTLLFRSIINWIKNQNQIWSFFKTKSGLRFALILAAILFYFLSEIIFIILVLLLLISIFKPQWLIRNQTSDKNQKVKPDKKQEGRSKRGE